MSADKVFEDASEFANQLRAIRRLRRQNRLQNHWQKRRSLTADERATILQKTAARCHICGGAFEAEEPWEADHVFPHAQGGAHSVGNYLPAHSICNNYRWFYAVEELQWILKLGVWLRTQIEKEKEPALAQKFIQYEKRRDARRKPR